MIIEESLLGPEVVAYWSSMPGGTRSLGVRTADSGTSAGQRMPRFDVWEICISQSCPKTTKLRTPELKFSGCYKGGGSGLRNADLGICYKGGGGRNFFRSWYLGGFPKAKM